MGLLQLKYELYTADALKEWKHIFSTFHSFCYAGHNWTLIRFNFFSLPEALFADVILSSDGNVSFVLTRNVGFCYCRIFDRLFAIKTYQIYSLGEGLFYRFSLNIYSLSNGDVITIREIPSTINSHKEFREFSAEVLKRCRITERITLIMKMQ